MELFVNNLWRNGPNWLNSPGNGESIQDIPMPPECISEMKAKDRKITHSLLTTEEKMTISHIMNYNDFSSTEQLYRVTAYMYVLRFVAKLKKSSKSGDARKTTTMLSAQEISCAEVLWIKESQCQLIEDRNFESWKPRFGLFVDEAGLWRCGRRLSNANIPFSTKHPILLHRNHPLTTLIIRKAHEKVLHNGVKETLTEIRSKYWIVKGRSLIKMIIHKCITCKRFEDRPYIAPPPPPLPNIQVTEESPFIYTGIDFAGPLYIKCKDGTSSHKLSVHIHVDIVLTTSAFLWSLKQFTARRGLPQKFISDNGKTFKAATKLLSAITSHEEVQQYLSDVGIEWVFNVEKAPWWGGIFEHMVRSTK